MEEKKVVRVYCAVRLNAQLLLQRVDKGKGINSDQIQTWSVIQYQIGLFYNLQSFEINHIKTDGSGSLARFHFRKKTEEQLFLDILRSFAGQEKQLVK